MNQQLLLILIPCLVSWANGSPEAPPQYNDPSGYDPNQYYNYMNSDQIYRDYVPPVTPPNIPGGPPVQGGPIGGRPAAPPIPDTSLPGPPLAAPPMPGPPMPGPPMTGPPLLPYPEIPQFYFNAGFNKGV